MNLAAEQAAPGQTKTLQVIVQFEQGASARIGYPVPPTGARTMLSAALLRACSAEFEIADFVQDRDSTSITDAGQPRRLVLAQIWLCNQPHQVSPEGDRDHFGL